MTTLRSRIQTSLIGLQTRREPGLGEEGDNLIKEIMSLDVRAHDGDTLLVGAQLMIFAQMLEAQTMMLPTGDDKAGRDRMEEMETEMTVRMKRVWELLSNAKFENDTRKALARDMMMLDVGQRLEDPVALNKVYSRVVKAEGPPEVKPVLFCVAPYLAKWKDMAEHHEALSGNPRIAQQFHEMAEQMALPDFNMLIEQVKKMGLHKVEKEQPVEDLPNKTIIVDKVDVTFKDVIVEHSDEKMAEQLRNEILANQPENGGPENIPLNPDIDTVIKISGGLIHCPGLGEQPISMCGPYLDEDTIRLQGYTLMGHIPEEQANNPTFVPDGNTEITQTEELYELKRTETGYKGRYSSQHKKVQGGSAEQPDLLGFEFEVELTTHVRLPRPDPLAPISAGIDDLTLD